MGEVARVQGDRAGAADAAAHDDGLVFERLQHALDGEEAHAEQGRKLGRVGLAEQADRGQHRGSYAASKELVSSGELHRSRSITTISGHMTTIGGGSAWMLRPGQAAARRSMTTRIPGAP